MSRLTGPSTDGFASGVARSPGVDVLFEPAVEPVTEPMTEPMAPDDRVWNPFRHRRRPPPEGPTDRPTISHLHTRRNATRTTVIATLVHGGRLAHGTAVGPPVTRGVLGATAEATVAALRVVAGQPLPVAVDRVSLASVRDPGTVSVAITWGTGTASELLVGRSAVRDDVGRAVMQATLDAVGDRLESLLVPPAP